MKIIKLKYFHDIEVYQSYFDRNVIVINQSCSKVRCNRREVKKLIKILKTIK